MICQKCGSVLNENTRICPQCGAPVEGEEQFVTKTTTYNGPLGNPTPVLVWGIVGLATSLTFFFSWLGIIFSCIGLKKARSYNQFTDSAPSNQARIGRKLSIAGIIAGIVCTVLFIIYIIAIIVVANNGGFSGRPRFIV